MPEVALLDDRRKIQLVPLGFVGIAVIVVGLKAVVAVEVELPHVLAHRVAPDAAAGSIVDVVVDFAVVNKSANPGIILAAVFVVPGGILHVGLLADEDV